MKELILKKMQGLGIPELKKIKSLNELHGDYINLECKLPNGKMGKILDDNKTYYGCQTEQKDSDKCYGVAADEEQLAVYSYGCGGADAELIHWIKL